jgi:hypothetical protein
LFFALLILTGCQRESASPTARANDQDQLLMKAVKHYYEVFDQVRATNNASLIDPVTDPDGVDRSNTQAFVLQQLQQNKASITTREVFSNWIFTVAGTTATVYYDYQASGYDVNFQTKQALESEVTLQPHRDKMELRRHGDAWLVFNRQPA